MRSRVFLTNFEVFGNVMKRLIYLLDQNLNYGGGGGGGGGGGHYTPIKTLQKQR